PKVHRAVFLTNVPNSSSRKIAVKLSSPTKAVMPWNGLASLNANDRERSSGKPANTPTRISAGAMRRNGSRCVKRRGALRAGASRTGRAGAGAELVCSSSDMGVSVLPQERCHVGERVRARLLAEHGRLEGGLPGVGGQLGDARKGGPGPGGLGRLERDLDRLVGRELVELGDRGEHGELTLGRGRHR